MTNPKYIYIQTNFHIFHSPFSKSQSQNIVTIVVNMNSDALLARLTNGHSSSSLEKLLDRDILCKFFYLPVYYTNLQG